MSDATVVLVPGLRGHVEDHWQTHLAASLPSARLVPPLGRDAVARIVAIMESEGLTAKVSSIHVNGWIGGYDKLSTSRLALAEDFGIDIQGDRERIVFAGDSPNDQPMFAFFPNAVGVANVREMADLMTILPRYVTPSPGSAGFAELAQALLAAR